MLHDISLDLKKGEWISVLGESGCGKSTLLQILQKFYQPELGSILANDQPLDTIGHQSWRSMLGVMPQEVKIFNGTIIDNIILGSDASALEELNTFLVESGFERFFQTFPQGLATLIGEEGINISGGQKQLIGLVRALYRRPHLLLLDEPSSAMDRNTEAFVLDLLDKMKKNTMILTLTHTLKTAKRSDHIYLVENGTISIGGSHDSLIAHSDNLYAQSWSDYAISSK